MRWIPVTTETPKFTSTSVVRFIHTKIVLHEPDHFIANYPGRRNTLEYLEESPDSKGGASAEEATYDDLHTVLWECGIGAQGTETAIEELRKKFIITKRP